MGLVGDRSRIAAQVVSGIGFLGAGAIIRERGLIIGVTTGAGIWATAAVGMVLGSGHIAAGLFFTLLIVGTLAASHAMDRLVTGPCRHETLRLIFDAADGKVKFRIQAILDNHQYDQQAAFGEAGGGRQEVAIRYCAAHRDHRAFLASLITLPGVLQVLED
ncbi:MAG: MgtC/SapB family protein [Phycisphaerae bacterium]